MAFVRGERLPRSAASANKTLGGNLVDLLHGARHAHRGGGPPWLQGGGFKLELKEGNLLGISEKGRELSSRTPALVFLFE
eukprot:7145497-Pyramimonas_sp.AAC.1